jgi:DDE superfamily endonuclease/Helix-turn-helix of DDE superfamily endonuclease
MNRPADSSASVSLDHDNTEQVEYVVRYVTQHRQIAPEFLSAEQFKFFTGVGPAAFKDICFAFGKKAKLDLEDLEHKDQILLFLMKLRIDNQFDDLANRFDVSDETPARVFEFWLNIASEFFSDTVCWLPKEKIASTMPDLFKQQFPNTTCIISTVEVSVEQPKKLKAKNNSVKFLVAISPLGRYMFVSPTYEGRATDKYIVNSSGFLKRLQPGMEVMAHGGCYTTVAAEISAAGATLNVPAFATGKRLSLGEIVKSREEVAVRVHVERVLERLKKFRILNNEFPPEDVKKIEKIVVFCAGLCNLQPPVGKKKAAMKKCPKK